MRGPALVAAIMAAVVLGGGPAAAAERLVFALSTHRVLINSSFTGAELVLFGTVEPNGTARQNPGYDLVVTVTGPKQDVVTRRKERMLGIWVNLDSRTFVESPPTWRCCRTRRSSRSPGWRRGAACRSASTTS